MENENYKVNTVMENRSYNLSPNDVNTTNDANLSYYLTCSTIKLLFLSTSEKLVIKLFTL